MIKLLGKVPDNITIALSGGPDSMAALSFLNNGKRSINAVYFNHGTTHAEKAESFVTAYCRDNFIPLKVGKIQNSKPPNKSKEEHWRDERYTFFTTHTSNNPIPIIMGHHLDDAVEWWIFSSLHGESKLIPYYNQATNVIRPFLLTSKKELIDWLERKNVPYVTDPSNKSDDYMRNYIRNNIVPHASHVNPGLQKVICKKYNQLLRNDCGELLGSPNKGANTSK